MKCQLFLKVHITNKSKAKHVKVSYNEFEQNAQLFVIVKVCTLYGLQNKTRKYMVNLCTFDMVYN